MRTLPEGGRVYCLVPDSFVPLSGMRSTHVGAGGWKRDPLRGVQGKETRMKCKYGKLRILFGDLERFCTLTWKWIDPEWECSLEACGNFEPDTPAEDEN